MGDRGDASSVHLFFAVVVYLLSPPKLRMHVVFRFSIKQPCLIPSNSFLPNLCCYMPVIQHCLLPLIQETNESRHRPLFVNYNVHVYPEQRSPSSFYRWFWYWHKPPIQRFSQQKTTARLYLYPLFIKYCLDTKSALVDGYS